MLGLNEPEPPDQIPVVVGPDTTPDKTEFILFLQTDKFNPAFTTGALVMLIITLSVT